MRDESARTRSFFGNIRLFGAVSVILGALASLVLVVAVPVPAGAANGTIVTDSGLPDPTGVACTSSTSCDVVGYDSSIHGEVTTFNGSAFGSNQTVSGAGLLLGVACATASACVAVGYSGMASVVVPIYNGTAGSAQTVSGTQELEAISCPTTTLCVASGTDGLNLNGAAVPLTVQDTGTSMTVTAGTAVSVDGPSQLNAISCPSATSCEVAGGTSSIPTYGDVDKVTIGSGSSGPVVSFGTPQNVSGTSFDLSGIACPSTSLCMAVGSSPSNLLSVIPGPGGAPGPAQSTQAGNSIACPSSTECLAGGLRTVQTVGPSAPDGVNTFSGAGYFEALSCPSSTFCAGVGQGTSSSETFGVALAPTTASLSVSPTSPTVGQTVTYSATVSPAPDGGSVTFSDGGSSISCPGGSSFDTSTGVATCATQYFAASSNAHNITATYNGDSDYLSSGPSNTVPVTVGPASTTTTLSGPSSSPAGQSFTLTATVSPAPDFGYVEFSEGGSVVNCSGGGGTDVAVDPYTGQATCTLTFSGVTTTPLSFTAAYQGDSNYLGSGPSSPVDVSIVQASTTTSLFATTTSPTVDQGVTYTATVSPTPDGGSVEFFDGGSQITCSSGASLNSLTPGEATCDVVYTSASSTPHAITASYSGDTNYASSVTSSPVDVTVGPALTTTTLSASTLAPTVGQSVTYTATVSPVPDGGSVVFSDGATPISCSGGTQTVDTTTGKATCVETYTAASSTAHAITAAYAGDANFSASNPSNTESVTVGAAPTTTTLSATTTSPVVGESVTYTATVSPSPDGGSVTFSDGGSTITCTGGDQSVVDGQATCSVTYFTASSTPHAITATYEGDNDYSASPVSNAEDVTVDKAPTTTSLSASTVSPIVGESVTYTATVSPVPDGGSVVFSDGATPISCSGGTQTVDTTTGTATCIVTYTAASSTPHTITAAYAGDANYALSPASGAVDVTVDKAPTTTTLATSTTAPALGQQVTYTATVSPVPDGGSVVFSDNGTPVSCRSGTQTVNTTTGEATCAVTYHSASPASHAITAVYGGDSDYTASPKSNTVTVAPVVGYWEVAADGGVFNLGGAPLEGSLGGTKLNTPVVGIAPTPDGKGFWEVSAGGGVFTFGSASFHGSGFGMHLNKPIVGMAATPDGGGYWLVAADGGIFAFGDAPFFGSVPGALKAGQVLDQPVVGMAATPDGGGYWLVGADGGIFAFGDATYAGSMGGTKLNAPVVGIAASPSGGYWEVAADGGVFNFGGAPLEGSMGGTKLNTPVVGITSTSDGLGYWEVAAGGGVFNFGNAPYLGSLAGTKLDAPVVGVAAAS